jgi:simple sugar transport system ATP-binding protein
MENPPLFEMRNVSKSFGNIHAVENVNLKVEHGQVVGLVGDNGAGKSTLMKILSGYHVADQGEILFEGKHVEIKSPRDARTLGVEMIYQDRALVSSMSVARNIFMGRELTKRMGFLNTAKMNKETMTHLENLGLHVSSPDIEVGFLSGGEQQGVAITRAMLFKARLVILDEPTIALSLKEAQRVLDFIKRLKAEKISSIFISHNLYHVCPVADKFVVMSRGKIVADVEKEASSIEKITEMIMSGGVY